MTQGQTPFTPDTGAMNGIGTPPVPAETQVQPVTADTLSRFHARADEAELNTDLRKQILEVVLPLGEAALTKLFGL